jgi:hypothetical protein
VGGIHREVFQVAISGGRLLDRNPQAKTREISGRQASKKEAQLKRSHRSGGIAALKMRNISIQCNSSRSFMLAVIWQWRSGVCKKGRRHHSDRISNRRHMSRWSLESRITNTRGRIGVQRFAGPQSGGRMPWTARIKRCVEGSTSCTATAAMRRASVRRCSVANPACP